MTEQRRVRVAVAGSAGKMGREALATLTADARFQVVGLLARHEGQAIELGNQAGCKGFTDAKQLMVETSPDVWLDFTDARSVVSHVDACVGLGIRPVIGATGYSNDDLNRWNQECKRQGIGGIAAPNFAIGALLMIRFAKEAARLFPQAEIIELHHDGKKDAPSGTALRTAYAMAEAMEEAAANIGVTEEHPKAENRAADDLSGTLPSRGLVSDKIHIHSIRLPGLVAHQEVIFGGIGETLTIRHDSLSRSSFMQGVLFACERVMELEGLVYGLEHLLW